MGVLHLEELLPCARLADVCILSRLIRTGVQDLYLLKRVCQNQTSHVHRVGQNHIYIRCIYGNLGREITKYTVIYGAYIRFWPTLVMHNGGQ